MTQPSRSLVLVGGGHAHVHVVRAFGRRPEPGAAVTLLSRDLLTPYSGMLPGHIGGAYDYDTCHIDLAALARASGTRLVHAEATGLDLDRRLVLCRDAEPVSFDVLSLDIGSAPRMEAPGARDHAVPVKPVAPFLERWEAVVAQAGRTGAAPRIAVVGGGAGGVEAALAMRARLKEALARAGRPEAAAPLTLVTRGGLLPRFNARARAYLRDALARAEIAVQTGFDVARVEAGRLVAADGRVVEGDHLFWVTWAGAPAWLGETGLALDGRGFVAVDAALRATSHPFVFAAGDVAAVLPHPRDKAGVFAVRQGPPLADNLRRALRGEEPRPFTPQRTALALVGTGDGRAVAARGPLAMRGAWVWRLKQRIDRAWMDQYRES